MATGRILSAILLLSAVYSARAQCGSTSAGPCPSLECNSRVGVPGQFSEQQGQAFSRSVLYEYNDLVSGQEYCSQLCEGAYPTCGYWTFIKDGESVCILFRAAQCPSESGYLPNATCDPKGFSGNPTSARSVSGAACSAAPSAPSPGDPGAEGDPHYTGADGSRFDFTGLPGRKYCMLSDAHVHINVLHGGRFDRWGDNPHKPLTWIRQLAILWGHHVVHLAARAGSDLRYAGGYMQNISIDGVPLHLAQPGDTAVMLDGKLKIKWIAGRLRSGLDFQDRYEIAIAGVLRLLVTVRPEVKLLRTPEDAVVHLSLELPEVAVTPNVHGVLGQTFRRGRQDRLSQQKLVWSTSLNVNMVPGDNAEGFLDGRTEDYEVSHLFAADCKMSRFARADEQDLETAQAIEMSTHAGGESVYAQQLPRKMVTSVASSK